jgi:hypothetical protein
MISDWDEIDWKDDIGSIAFREHERIEETKVMYAQLSKEYDTLARNHGDYFELKSLELELLRVEGQLRDLGVDF